MEIEPTLSNQNHNRKIFKGGINVVQDTPYILQGVSKNLVESGAHKTPFLDTFT